MINITKMAIKQHTYFLYIFICLYCITYTNLVQGQACVDVYAIAAPASLTLQPSIVDTLLGDLNDITTITTDVPIASPMGGATFNANANELIYIEEGGAIPDLNTIDGISGNNTEDDVDVLGISELQYNCGNDILYALQETNTEPPSGNFQLVALDNTTGNTTTIGGPITTPTGIVPGTSTIDTENNIYFFIHESSSGTYVLNTIDIDTGLNTSFTLPFTPIDIDYDLFNNQLVAISSNLEVILIDATAPDTQTTIGTISLSGATLHTGNAAIDPFTQRLFCTGETDAGLQQLYTIDLTTATITNTANTPYQLSNLLTTIPCVPIPDFEFDGTCLGQNMQFNADISIGANAWTWDFGDPGSPNNTSTEIDPTHFYAIAGTYTVSLNITGCIGDANVTQEVTILTPPQPELPDSVFTCEHEILLDPGDFPDVSYLWITGQSSQTIVAFADETWYYVDISLNGCVIRDSVYVDLSEADTTSEVWEADEITFCEGTDAILMPDITGESYQWSTGDETPEIPVTAGIYQITVTQGECELIDEIEVFFVSELPVDLGNSAITVCALEYILDPGEIAGADYLWSTGDQTQTINVDAAGEYWVEVTLGDCTNSDTITLNLIAFDPPSLGPDSLKVCESQPLTLDATTTGANYIWSNGETSPMLEVPNDAPGLYWVDIRVGNECETRDSVYVEFVPDLSVDLGADRALCEGVDLILDSGVRDAVNIWSTGELNDSITITSPGTYSVTVDNGGCVDTDEVTISAHLPETINLGNADGSDVTICPALSESVTLNAGNGNNFVWSSGETTSQIVVSTGGTYSIEKIDDFGCTINATVNVLEVCSSIVQFPNAFSPNEDGFNDVFRPKGRFIENYQLAIYDRWGKVIFESNDIEVGWDGFNKGVRAELGVYVWFITYTNSDGEAAVEQGNLTLVR